MESLLSQYHEDRSRQGEPGEGSFTGAAGGAACGDLARISVEPISGRIERVTFDAEGCAATRAACSCIAEMVEGGSILEAAAIGTDDLDRALGGLSPVSSHAAVLATDALHRALSALASSGSPIADPNPDRVLVAVSGGVDSAVAALRERERGAEVVAVTVKLWADPDTDGTKACCSPEAVLGARAVTHSMGIPHFTLDLEDQFRSRVVSRFLDGYAEGQTPNPCVLCNGEVRISAMVELADRLGATHLVTGHYAQIVNDGEGDLLAEGSDSNKDQSYMLAALPTAVISRLRFPLARISKPEVREIASRNSLSVAKKPESQDLCFLAGSSKKAFLQRHADLGDLDGPVLDSSGREIGRHSGHHHFTVGQRRGIGVAAARPLYVTATDAATNSVTAGPREELAAERVSVGRAVMHRDGARVDRVRLRYRSAAVPATVVAPAGCHDLLEIELGQPFEGVAPGQAAVLMSGETVVGHGTIK
ncbi:MAG: tRNA 2-thiouridine(34) synthase MnmA [Solirubrobacterales bacterium]